MEKVNEIVMENSWEELKPENWMEGLEFSFKAYLNCIGSAKKNDAITWLERLNEFLEKMNIEKLSFIYNKVSFETSLGRIEFGTSSGPIEFRLKFVVDE